MSFNSFAELGFCKRHHLKCDTVSNGRGGGMSDAMIVALPTKVESNDSFAVVPVARSIRKNWVGKSPYAAVAVEVATLKSRKIALRQLQYGGYGTGFKGDHYAATRNFAIGGNVLPLPPRRLLETYCGSAMVMLLS